MRLDNAAAIAQLLTRALDSRAAFAVRIAQASGVYSSLLLEVDYTRRSLVLDECVPRAGHELAQPGATLRLQARIDGGHIEFSGRVLEVIRQGAGDAYRIELPKQMLHHERRYAYRLPVSPDLPMSSFLSADDGQPRRARLIDISRQGAGTVMLNPVKAKVGASLACVLELPDLRLDTEALVRCVEHSGGQQRLGLMFDNLAPAKRHSVERAVSSIERSMLRQQVKSRWM